MQQLLRRQPTARRGRSLPLRLLTTTFATLLTVFPLSSNVLAQHSDHARTEVGEVLSLDVNSTPGPQGAPLDILVTVEEKAALELHHFRSADDGATWQGPHRVALGEHQVMRPHRSVDHQVVSRGDLVLAAFTAHDSASPFGSGALAVSRSLDGGVTWMPLPSPSDQAVGGHGFADMGFDSTGALHLVWLDGRDGDQGLRYAQSHDRGESWSPNQTLDGRTCECCWNSLQVDPDDRLHVLYRDRDPRDMRLVSSTDGGSTWKQQGWVGEFDWGIDGCPHVGGGIASTSGVEPGKPQLHAVVWTGRDDRHGTYALSSSDRGASWSAPTRFGGERSRRADLTSLGDVLYGAWDERVNGDSVVFVAASRDGGRTWEPAMRLSTAGATTASLPKIVTNGRVAVAVWTEKVGPVAGWKASVVGGASGPQASARQSTIDEP